MAGERQIEADDAVLVEGNPVLAHHRGHREAQRGEQKGAGALAVLDRAAAALVDADAGGVVLSRVATMADTISSSDGRSPVSRPSARSARPSAGSRAAKGMPARR
jgi:hypothetical protein